MTYYSIQRESYRLEAIAEDRGDTVLSRTVEVQIDVVDRSNKPPVWDNAVYGPIYVKENTAVGQTVTSVKARCVLNLPSPLSFFCWEDFCALSKMDWCS